MSKKYIINNDYNNATGQLDVPSRFLFGPGPSNAHPRVLQQLGMRQVGHLDPAFLKIMQESQELLRYAWQTKNRMTIPVSGTGSAAMEACFANLIEPGDRVLVAVNGYFGLRMIDMAQRYGAEIVQVNKAWGDVFTINELEKAVQEFKPKMLAVVHAETSTGACQPIDGLGKICRDADCLLVVDTVTSLGGVPLFIDDWEIDAAYSGSQKCLSCPPGIAPLTFGDRALEKLMNRKNTVANWYLDLTMVGKYWGSERTYHHTAPINMNYALREALRLVVEEGLAERWERHQKNANTFWDGLEAMGLKCHVPASHRLPSLTTVCVPEGVDAKAVQTHLLHTCNIEIAGGLGELAGKVWRIGLMGYNSREENVLLLLTALEKALSNSQS